MKRKRATKNAKAYQRKLKSLLRTLPRVAPAAIAPGPDRVYFMIEAIFQADATRKQAAAATASLKEEYLDLNELRVSPVRDIVECVGRDMPLCRHKAEMTVAVLNDLFFRVNDITLNHMEQLSARELKRTLAETALSSYAAACVALYVFGVHATPVDWTLAEALKLGGYVPPDSEPAAVQQVLERMIAPKNAVAAAALLKTYGEKAAKQLPPPPEVEPIAAETEQEIAQPMAHVMADGKEGIGGHVPPPPAAAPTQPPPKAAAPKVARDASKKVAAKLKKLRKLRKLRKSRVPKKPSRRPKRPAKKRPSRRR